MRSFHPRAWAMLGSEIAYRSAIFTHRPEQATIAERVIEEVQAVRFTSEGQKIVTDILVRRRRIPAALPVQKPRRLSQVTLVSRVESDPFSAVAQTSSFKSGIMNGFNSHVIHVISAKTRKDCSAT
ncbi:hypothetical protein HYDPIDRAFT_115499 [Hydnomerulius pinastri MD-312]|uniref:Uncharacterized protein n=1 Tax=Hydnomerulius pinastri MD-312 TaxID=994086 RepID=A0A0C9V7U6_9AGAM|nr:hypothetical protein HYDPIDRAFT_115499 [Hydnomerulius pinastri MD-312]